MPKKIYFWIAAIWTLIIAVLCLVSFKKLPEVKLANADKYVHATFHFFFTVFWYLHFRNDSKLKLPRILGKVWSFSIIYGCLIEIAQELFTTTRHADIMDVLANFTGAALAVILLIAVDRFKKNRQA